jgi:hypothetical protein
MPPLIANTDVCVILKEHISLYSENHNKHINKFCEQSEEFVNVKTRDRYYNHLAFGIKLVYI